jgi:hypothetical protein
MAIPANPISVNLKLIAQQRSQIAQMSLSDAS